MLNVSVTPVTALDSFCAFLESALKSLSASSQRSHSGLRSALGLESGADGFAAFEILQSYAGCRGLGLHTSSLKFCEGNFTILVHVQ